MFPPYTMKCFIKTGVMLLLSALILAGCGSSKKAKIDPKYGVAASPRVDGGTRIRKGGGRYQIGKPYKVAGKRYVPRKQPGYNKTGRASWYGKAFHGRLTANGEVFDMNALTAAHPTLPLPSYVRVTNLSNKKSTIVRVNDRGPFARGRIIDVSRKVAQRLDFIKQGTAKVRVQYVGKAPLHGRDHAYLSRSYSDGGFFDRRFKRDTPPPIQVAAKSSTSKSSRHQSPSRTISSQTHSRSAYARQQPNALRTASPPAPVAAPVVGGGVAKPAHAPSITPQIATLKDPIQPLPPRPGNIPFKVLSAPKTLAPVSLNAPQVTAPVAGVGLY